MSPLPELDTGPRYIHPDAMVRRCFWSATPRVAPSTRASGTITRYAAACRCGSTTWAAKTTTGKGQNKRLLVEPIAVCARCGVEWPTWQEDDHLTTGVAGSGITKRGRWTRFIHVGSTLRPRTSTEERLFGSIDLSELLRLRRIARTLYRHPTWRWPARVYFAYALGFYNVRGRGGQEQLAREAAIEWAHAPFNWHRKRVHAYVIDGRAEWARRLVRAGLIAGGTWWQYEPEDRDREKSPSDAPQS